MADRSVKVTLRAEVADFKRQVASAGSSLEDLAKKGDKTGQVSQTFMGRMVQSAQLQREAWTTAGTALTGFGAAVTGIGVAALSTGISYNQLQQTSRAALTTLTGSAEEANAQMDRLDEFASTSPFAKDVFIRAQQQMLGFGIEAGKVIPYLDAIQNAVAATGGSNQDIAELSRIFSQISASAKITGEDLREFGNRGIDAATIIGSQMGMTGAQIREQITAGTLDAGTALDALASGMDERFGGAADNVKNTLSGAFDRVKAAWRDLSSELASPLVGTEGGGLLTGLLNRTADLMRAFQDLPGPVKTAVGALGGIAGAGSLAGGAFLLLTPRIIDTMQALRDLKPRFQDFQEYMPRLSGAIGKVGKAMGAMTVAFAGAAVVGSIARHFEDAEIGAEQLENQLRQLPGSVDPIATAFGDLFPEDQIANADEFRAGLERLAEPNLWDRIRGGFTDFTRFLSGNDRLGMSGLEKTQERLEQIGATLGGLASTDLPEVQRQFTALWEAAGGDAEAGALLLDSMPGLREALTGLANDLGVTATDANLLALATGDLTPEIEAAQGAAADLADEEERLAEVTRITTEEARDQIDAFQSLYDTMRQISGEFMGLEEAQAAWGDLLRENVDVMDEFLELSGDPLNEAGDGWNTYSESGSFAIETLHGLAEAGLSVVDALRENDAAADEVAASIDEVRQQVIDQAMAFGMSEEAANAYADQLGLVPDNVNTAVYLDSDQAEQDVADLRFAIDNMPDGTITVNGETVPAEDAVNTLLDTVAQSEGDVVINGETVPAEEALATALELVNNGVGFINIDGSTEDFDLRVANSVAMAADTPANLDIHGNDKPILDTLARTIAGIDDSVGIADIDADPTRATAQTDWWRTWTDRSTGTAGIDAEDRGASGMLSRTMTMIRSKTGNVGIGANARWGQINAVIAAIQNRAGSAGASVVIGGVMGRASGGEVWGAGTATSDSIPALLSNGEFVVRTAAADHYGRGLLHAINNMSLPKHVPAFASGGSVGVHSAAGTQTVIQRVPVPTHLTVVDADGALVGSMRVAAHGEDRAFDRIKGAWA